MNEDFSKKIKEKKFLLKEKSILQFDEIKYNVKDELINAKLYTGTQVRLNSIFDRYLNFNDWFNNYNSGNGFLSLMNY